MTCSVTARHCEVGDEVKSRAEAVVARLGQYSPHLLESQVVFDAAPEGEAVEVRLHLRGGKVLVASAAAADHRTALDRAEDKLRKQLEKDTTRGRRSRRAGDQS